MDIFVAAFIIFLVLLFILLSLAPFINDSADVSLSQDFKRRSGERDAK